MALGFGLSAGAGGMADALQDALKQKFLEQLQLKKFAEEQRQADLQHAIARRQLDQGDRRIGLDERKFGEDTRQFDVTSGHNARRIAIDEAESPVRIGQIRAQTTELQRKPQAEADARAHDLSLADVQNRNVLGQINARGAQDRATARFRLEGAAQGQGAGGGGGASPYAAERSQRIVQSVDELAKKVNNWTTGGGSVFSNIPGTDARNFNAELDSLKANIAFGELAEMRAASKTGGALGSVSERELALLESSLGALDPGQSPENFKAQLKKVKESIERWNQAKAGGAPPNTNGNGGGGRSSGGGGSVDDLLKKYGG